MSADKYPSIFSRQMEAIVDLCGCVIFLYHVHLARSLVPQLAGKGKRVLLHQATE